MSETKNNAKSYFANLLEDWGNVKFTGTHTYCVAYSINGFGDGIPSQPMEFNQPLPKSYGPLAFGKPGHWLIHSQVIGESFNNKEFYTVLSDIGAKITTAINKVIFFDPHDETKALITHFTGGADRFYNNLVWTAFLIELRRHLPVKGINPASVYTWGKNLKLKHLNADDQKKWDTDPFTFNRWLAVQTDFVSATMAGLDWLATNLGNRRAGRPPNFPNDPEARAILDKGVEAVSNYRNNNAFPQLKNEETIKNLIKRTDKKKAKRNRQTHT